MWCETHKIVILNKFVNQKNVSENVSSISQNAFPPLKHVAYYFSSAL